MCNKRRDHGGGGVGEWGRGLIWLQPTTLTVLVAWLSEGLPLGENDSHRQILEGRDVEEGRVLVVPDVLGVNISIVYVGHGIGNVAGTTRWGGK